jgi:hypothetical protein
MKAAAEKTILEALKATGKPFEDTSFELPTDRFAFARPKTDTSDATDAAAARVHWTPPPLGPTHALSPGALEHSWFVGAVGLVAFARADVLGGLFVASLPACGGHAIRLFRDGEWRVLLVDDRIPAPPPALARVLCPAPELHPWLSLLEKAFAKLHGAASYAAISCPGLVSEALQDITGVTPLTVPTKGDGDRGALWALVRDRVARRNVVGVFRSERAGDPLGIANGVPYSVLSAEELPAPLGKVCIVRATLGAPVWTGRFSRQSPEYESIPARLRALLDAGSGPGAELMAFEDVLARFNEFYMVEIP